MSSKKGFAEKHPYLSAVGAAVGGLWLYKGGAKKLAVKARAQKMDADKHWVAQKGYDLGGHPDTPQGWADRVKEIREYEARQKRDAAAKAAADRADELRAAANERATQANKETAQRQLGGTAETFAESRTESRTSSSERTTTRGGAFR